MLVIIKGMYRTNNYTDMYIYFKFLSQFNIVYIYHWVTNYA